MTAPHHGKDQDPMTDIADTPCQRNCCWTPHRICTTRYTCRHHISDQHRSRVALSHRGGSRHLFSNPEVHISPAAEQGRTDLRPTFSHQEQDARTQPSIAPNHSLIFTNSATFAS